MSLTFDDTKYHLGSLCKRNHDWNKSGQSLRDKTYCCTECRKMYSKQTKQKKTEKVKQLAVIQLENSLVKFDANTFYLGTLCLRNHEFEDNKTLRFINSGCCFTCHQIKTIESQKREDPIKRKERRQKTWIKNREKGIARQQDWRKRNPDNQKRYRKTLKGKAVLTKYNTKRRAFIESNHSTNYSSDELANRYKVFDYKCVYCKEKATALDHFIPINHGGCDVIGNMVTACSRCNSSKRDTMPEIWYPFQPFYSRKRWNKILKVLGKNENNLTQLPLF